MSSSDSRTVGIVIPTFNAAKELGRVLDPLSHSSYLPKILVIDSSSTDDTVAVAKKFGAKTEVIPMAAFNHGATREKARKLIGTDIVVMMTQDAFPLDNRLLENLLAPLVSGRASVAYARQLPRPGAGVLESFPREFNYPSESHVRSISDVGRYGVYTFFCSDSCAAYINSALDEVGGFPAVRTHEDYFVVARLLQRGHRIAYVAEALVEHSHRYTIGQEFKRYFDAGYVRAENPWVSEIVGQAEERGFALLWALIRRLLAVNPLLIPYAILTMAAKWFGFRCGFYSFKVRPNEGKQK